MKFNLVKGNNPMSNKKVNRGILIGTAAVIVLTGGITITALLVKGNNKINPGSSSLAGIISSQDKSSTSDSSIDSSSKESSSENTTTSEATSSDNNPSSSSQPKSSSNPTTSSSKPGSSSSTPSSSSQPVVDGYFNPRDPNAVAAIVNSLNSQMIAYGSDDRIANKDNLTLLVLAANQVKATGFDSNTHMDSVFLQVTEINTAAVVERMYGLETSDYKKPQIDKIAEIFANKKDREIVKILMQEKASIDNMAYEGKSGLDFKPAVDSAFNRINNFAFGGGKISTSQGQIGYNDLGDVAKFFVMEYVFLIVDSYADSLNESQHTNYDVSGMDSKMWPEMARLKNKLFNDTRNAYLSTKNQEKILTLVNNNKKLTLIYV
jgi:hypothetical protein